MTKKLSDLTIDGVIACLVNAVDMELPDGSSLKLDDQASRAALAFYWQNKTKYFLGDKDAAILESEIDQLLTAVGKPVTALPQPADMGNSKHQWRLTRLETHRFRGLQRHCRAGGADPDFFFHDFDSELTLFRGFNGAGKTSLLSAICWCLTGLGYQAQGLPIALHDPIDIWVETDEESEADAIQMVAPVGFKLPPIVPIPSHDELALVGGNAKHDTWVKLTFTANIAGAEVCRVVQRVLQRTPQGKFSTTATGLEDLDIADMALQVGTLMPAIASAMRFDDQTNLSKAVSVLTGLRPLSNFGDRSVKVLDRLTGKFKKQAEESRDTFALGILEQINTLSDLASEFEGLPALVIGAPDQSKASQSVEDIGAARTKLNTAYEKTKESSLNILGSLPDLNNETQIEQFQAAIPIMEALLVGSSLKALPSFSLATQVGDITEEDVGIVEGLLAAVSSEAIAFAERQKDAVKSARLRLYALVGSWHEANHPGQPVSECPVCTKSLIGENSKIDPILQTKISAALEEGRNADSKLNKTANDWELSTWQDLRGNLPASIEKLVREKLPARLSDLYKAALTGELFTQADAPKILKGLAKTAPNRWANLWTEPPLESVAGLSLPAEVPDSNDLRKLIAKIERIVAMYRFRKQHAEAIQDAIKRYLNGSENDQQGEDPAHWPLKQQIAELKNYASGARGLAKIERQLKQIETGFKNWSAQITRLENLSKAASAVQPFADFSAVVRQQVDGLISLLNDRMTFWADKIYRAQFNGAPALAGLNPDSPSLSILASTGRHKIEAQHVLNASALRAYLWAFVLSLWEEMWKNRGGLSCFLMDDPQDLFDPANVANFAATIPLMVHEGIQPLVVSNDFNFLEAVQSYVRGTNNKAIQLEVGEFSPISTSKCTATIAPILDEIRERNKAWKAAENDPVMSRELVYPIRVRIEFKLWDLLANDPQILHNPTLDLLLGRISSARTNGELPFNELPFEALLDLPMLKSGAQFREIINRAHHGRADQITPADAAIVSDQFARVLDAIDTCWISYARFMRRLPFDSVLGANDNAPEALSAIALPGKFQVIGKLAAREPDGLNLPIGHDVEEINFGELQDIALFTVRTASLGLVALPGQTLIVSLSKPVKNGDLAVVQYGDKLFARRVGLDKSDPSRVALESIPSTSGNVAPTHFVPKAKVRLNKIIGVLYDNIGTAGSGEALPVQSSPMMLRVKCAARIVGDSAYPIAQDGQYVLLEPRSGLTSNKGDIVAIRTQADAISYTGYGYLKRIGKSIPSLPHVHYLENVGLSGEGLFVQMPSTNPTASVEIIDQAWTVLGVISLD